MQNTTARILSVNTAWNLVGYVVPLAVGVVTIPTLIHGLGTERFGILSLAWVVIGSFSLFDFGLGRAVTQVVATALGRDSPVQLRPIVWSGLLLMVIFGVAGAGILAAVSPALVHSGLRIPSRLQPESLAAFYLLAGGLPLVVVTAGLRGILEAQQRFGLSNAVRIPLGAFMFVGPVLILPWTNSLAAAVLVLLIGRLVAAVAYLWICFKATPGLAGWPIVRVSNMTSVLRLGTWIAVSNFISPFLVYADRFVIGATLSIVAVAYYAVPFDLIVRVLFIPGAIASVFFPAFATSFVSQPNRTSRLFVRATKYLFILMFPIMLITIVLANEGLRLWVGVNFAHNSTRVLQLLAIGVFANGLAQMPFALIQATGRPDLAAKLHLVEAVIYLPCLLLLIAVAGIEGAALAWSLRVVADMIALFILARSILTDSLRGLYRLSVPLLATLTLMVLAILLPSNLSLKAVFLVLTLGAFAIVTWFRFLSIEERSLAIRASRGFPIN
jgi:O-antigen/teichoic acid export membrane protein